MINQKYSAVAFEKLGFDSEGSNLLLDELEASIRSEVHEITSKYLNELVSDLNRLGHDLRLVDSWSDNPKLPVSVSFRDEKYVEGEYRCKLRIALDTVISLGYPDLSHDHDSSSDL